MTTFSSDSCDSNESSESSDSNDSSVSCDISDRSDSSVSCDSSDSSDSSEWKKISHINFFPLKIVTKLKLKLWQNLKKKSNCDKTQKHKL